MIMEREKKIIETSIQGILVNVFLVIFKAIIGIIVNSIAIILDALNNFTDAISSIITIIGTKLANKAPDKEHPFGHGRIEYFTSAIISAIVLIAGVTAIKESVEKIINPVESNYSIISLIIIAVAVIVKFVFGKHVKKVGKKYNSQSLVASGQDAFMDSILSLTTLIAAIINYFGHISLEGYLGVIIGIVIIKSAIEILKETIDDIIGQRADKELAKKIKDEVCSYNEVQGAYDLTLHNYGPLKTIATVHIQVRDDMTANEIHTLTREMTIKIFEKYGIITTIGIYAANDKGDFADIKKELLNIIKQYNDIKQVHGFYVDKKNKKIYFDLIIDFECANPENIKEDVIKSLKEKYSQFEYNVILDSDFSD